MTGIAFRAFGGVVPRLAPHLLPEGSSQVAENVRLGGGALEFWNRPLAITALNRVGVIKSIYRMYNGSLDYWLSWVDVVDAVRGPIAGDTAFKLYYSGDSTGGGRPKKTNLTLATSGGTDYPHDYLEMGLPAPLLAGISCNVVGGSASNVDRSYVFTYVSNVNEWAEEGPPSAVFTQNGKPDGSWNFTVLPAGPAGKYDWTNGKLNIYRVLVDSAGNGNYQRVGQIALGTTTFNDTVLDKNLGVICPSFIVGVVGSEWVAPPDDLHGLIAMPNGVFAGISGNQVCFSYPYQPHAWPVRQRYAMNHTGVALARIGGSSLLAVTKGWPVVFTGNTPSAMNQTDIEEAHPCVSARSAVRLAGGGGFATREGFKLVGPGGVGDATNALMDGKDWRELCFPDTLICINYENMLIGFFNDGDSGRHFVLDRESGRLALSFGDYNVSCAWSDPYSGRLYLVEANNVLEWDADELNLSPGTWRSPRVVLAKPANMGMFDIDADFEGLEESALIEEQIEADAAFNEILLALDDLAALTAWAPATVYGVGAVRKSIGGVYKIICTVGGTSGGSEPAYPATLGNTFADNTVTWKLVWDIEDAIKGSLRSHMLRGYVPYDTSSDPLTDGAGSNGDGIMLRGSLLVGGLYANFDNRSLLIRFYANGELVHEQQIFDRGPHRLPRLDRCDIWEVEISGNVKCNLVKVAESGKDLARL